MDSGLFIERYDHVAFAHPDQLFNELVPELLPLDVLKKAEVEYQIEFARFEG
jgi:hypothetical protein